MKKILINKLHEYIRETNPHLLVQLKEDRKVIEYLSEKVGTVAARIKQTENDGAEYIIEDACMDVLTQDLKPSNLIASPIYWKKNLNLLTSS